MISNQNLKFVPILRMIILSLADCSSALIYSAPIDREKSLENEESQKFYVKKHFFLEYFQLAPVVIV